MTFTLTAQDRADLLAQVTDLTGVTLGSGGGGGGTPPPTGDASPDPNQWSPEKVTAVYFPADPTMAKFPSPEGSMTVCAPDGTLSGRPYVRTVGGAIYKWQIGTDGKPVLVVATKPPSGHVLLCNNVPASTNGMLDAIIAQGQAYMHVAPGGQTLKTSGVDNPGSGTSVTQVPALWSDPFFGSYNSGSGSGGGSGGGGGVPMPPDPPAQSVPYGATGKVVMFGPDQTAKTIAAALTGLVQGDSVKAAPSAYGLVYAESFDIPDCVQVDCGGRWSNISDSANRIWSDGAIIDGSTLPPSAYSHGLGGVVFAGNGKLVGAHVKGFGNQSTGHDGTGGLRAKGNCIGQIQGDHLFIENCQNGIGPGGTQIISGPWTNTVIVDCGLAVDDGGAHNVYDSSNVVRSFVGPNFFSSVKPFPKGGGGHAYKTRASAVTVTGPGYFYSGDSSSFDIPDGTSLVATIGTGITFEKKAGDINHTIFGYGPESTTKGAAGINVASGATIIANCTSPNVFCNGPVDFAVGVTFQGGKITNMGSGKMTGGN